MLATMEGSLPGFVGTSTRSTVPVQIRLHGSSAAIRNMISIRVWGGIQSVARNATPHDSMRSVQPSSQVSSPILRNPRGKCIVKVRSTDVGCRADLVASIALKFYSVGISPWSGVSAPACFASKVYRLTFPSAAVMESETPT
jgi:hypothetical protein